MKILKKPIILNKQVKLTLTALDKFKALPKKSQIGLLKRAGVI